jgi:hypothetical protein
MSTASTNAHAHAHTDTTRQRHRETERERNRDTETLERDLELQIIQPRLHLAAPPRHYFMHKILCAHSGVEGPSFRLQALGYRVSQVVEADARPNKGVSGCENQPAALNPRK